MFLIERERVQPTIINTVINTIGRGITLAAIGKRRIQPTATGCHADMIRNTFL